MTAFEAIAIEIANRVSQTGARPEDWLNEGFVYRITKEHAAEVLATAFADQRVEPGHVYPAGLGPQSRVPSVVVGFGVIDLVKPGVLSDVARTLLAGAIAGALDEAYRMGARGTPLDVLAERHRRAQA